ncbi:hypothetical protein AMTRI_Chr02g261660 [Amborella trichopoda]
MAMAMAMAARQAMRSHITNALRPNGSAQAPALLHRRGMAGDHHGPPKVNFWEDPLSPSKWKEEHFVIVSLSGWGLLFYGGYKFFTGGKKGKQEEFYQKVAGIQSVEECLRFD